MMPIEKFLSEVEKCDPGLLGQPSVGHEVIDGRVHLLRKDDTEAGIEVWIYPNEDGTFTYQRGDETEIRDTVNGVVDSVYGNS